MRTGLADVLSVRRTLAVTRRVLIQLRRDHRTLAMLLVLPCVIMTLLWWMFTELPGQGFTALAPALLALIPFIVMFLVTSVTTLRERTSGTLERLLAMPLGKGDFLLGYALAFGLVAGPIWMLLVVAVLDAVLGSALGLFVSAFARTEFQAVQFMPAIVIPQILLCGLFVDRDRLPGFLEAVSNVLPLSYAVDAMQAVSDQTEPAIGGDLALIGTFVVAALALGALTLRRRSA